MISSMYRCGSTNHHQMRSVVSRHSCPNHHTVSTPPIRLAYSADGVATTPSVHHLPSSIGAVDRAEDRTPSRQVTSMKPPSNARYTPTNRLASDQKRLVCSVCSEFPTSNCLTPEQKSGVRRLAQLWLGWCGTPGPD